MHVHPCFICLGVSIRLHGQRRRTNRQVDRLKQANGSVDRASKVKITHHSDTFHARIHKVLSEGVQL